MTNEQLSALIGQLATEPVTVQEQASPMTVVIAAGDLIPLCSALRSYGEVYADRLACITGVDNGPVAGTMEVIYHLDCITSGLTFALKVRIPRDHPEVPSLTGLWKSADWLEREIFDMYGIFFTGHPDLRRILMPADWEGYPLRKDYSEQETYHGVKVASEPTSPATSK
ncbi:MAG: NADH-quinone oxidoreductase subunit C [Bacteroidota bacterium]